MASADDGAEATPYLLDFLPQRRGFNDFATMIMTMMCGDPNDAD
jgi:hypothetical protein